MSIRSPGGKRHHFWALFPLRTCLPHSETQRRWGARGLRTAALRARRTPGWGLPGGAPPGHVQARGHAGRGQGTHFRSWQHLGRPTESRGGLIFAAAPACDRGEMAQRSTSWALVKNTAACPQSRTLTGWKVFVAEGRLMTQRPYTEHMALCSNIAHGAYTPMPRSLRR